jgi:DNA-directed RNA polymerase specialized sigma24 family protein
VPMVAQDEIVDDAITAVVMSPRGVRNEHHLLGAFWLAVDHRCRRYREGRHFARLGSRVRVEFEAAEHAMSGTNPFDKMELRDRFARAADLMADLDERERKIVCVMACYEVGPVPAARLLGLPLGEVRSAVRSANAKLDRVAAIAAAGRMCQFREAAIAADAAGEADERDAQLARAHVSACVSCGRVYRRLRREMRGREFQRAAAAAFLPAPTVPFGHIRGFGKLAIWLEQHVPFLPRGSSERAAEVLGGAGIVKATMAGTALVVAGSALTGNIVHSLAGPAHRPIHHNHGHHVVQQTYQPTALVKAWTTPIAAAVVPKVHISSSAHGSARRHRSPPLPPSKSDGYLAVGQPAPSSSSSDLKESSARVASVAPKTSAEAVSAPRPTQSGGGVSPDYLGKH